MVIFDGELDGCVAIVGSSEHQKDQFLPSGGLWLSAHLSFWCDQSMLPIACMSEDGFSGPQSLCVSH